MITPGSAAYWKLFDGFQRSAYRQESLPHYQADNEAGSLRAFLAGEPLPELAGKDRWTARVRAARAAGKTMSRVRVVSEPVSAYEAWEISISYPANLAAGEDIRVLPRSAGDALGLPHADFWLYDSEVLAWFRYNEDGRLLGADLERDPAVVRQAVRWRDQALAAAVPCREYVAGHDLLARRAS
jgi:hypothetical protein